MKRGSSMLILIATMVGLEGCLNGYRSANTTVSSSSAPSPSVTVPPALGSTPAPRTPTVPGLVLQLPGVNLSGAQYNAGKVGARLFFDYVYPTNAELDYYASKGMKIIRLPFDIDRLQPARLAALSATEAGYLDAVVQYAQTKGLIVLLDPHNFGYMNDNSGVSREIGVDPLMPNSYFADFWSRVATHFLTQDNVIFGLMNEPNAQSAVQWQASAAAAVQAIRLTGAKQEIFVQGTSWTGAESWVSSGNAAAWDGFTDSNFAFEVHEYLDADNSGSHVQCLTGKGATALVAFTQWASAHAVRGFLGEFGWSTDPTCPPEGTAITNYMYQNPTVWQGYTYWSGGPWLGPYMYSIEPTGLGTSTVVDQPQMAILEKNL